MLKGLLDFIRGKGDADQWIPVPKPPIGEIRPAKVFRDDANQNNWKWNPAAGWTATRCLEFTSDMANLVPRHGDPHPLTINLRANFVSPAWTDDGEIWHVDVHYVLIPTIKPLAERVAESHRRWAAYPRH